MIHVHRNFPAPDSIKNNGQDEHDDAHEYYEKLTGKFVAFKHRVYTKKDVIKALEDQFEGKCAYCESIVDVTSPIDKEHFRPKGSIVDKANNIQIKPGYYWLAADWDNLLLACPNCNRTGTFEDSNAEEFVAGKLDQFPLSDESKRCSYGDNLKEEEKVRLLINPCVDYPEALIAYDKFGMILPDKSVTGHDKLKVETTIKVFGLYRSKLVKERKEELLRIENTLQNLIDNYNDYLSSQEGDKTAYLERIERNFAELKRLKGKKRQYLGIKRYFVREKLEQLRDIIAVLQLKDS